MSQANKGRLDRASWLALGVVLLAAGASATTALLILVRVGDGCILDNFTPDAAVVETCVGDWPTPLRPGDAVVAVDGVKTPNSTDVRWQRSPPNWVDGGVAEYSVRRVAQTLDLAVPLQRLGVDGVLRAFGHGAVRQLPDWNTPVFLGAVVIFALAPRARAAQLLLVAMGGLTSVTTLFWPSASVHASFAPAALQTASFFLSTVWGWFFIPTLLVLVLSFPRRAWPLTSRPGLSYSLIYGLPLIASALTLLTTNSAFALAALGLGVLYVGITLFVVVAHTFLRVHDAVIRAQTAWLALGLVLGLLIWPLFFVLAFLFPGLLPPLNQLPGWARAIVSATLALPFPVCLGIAILRYRLFEIDVIINRALVYGALSVCVVGLYVLVVGSLGAAFRTPREWRVVARKCERPARSAHLVAARRLE